MNSFNTRRCALAAAALAGLVGGPKALADLNITTDAVVDGSTLTIDPPGGLFVSHESNDPLLTLTNMAGSEGVEGVVVGSLNGESGRLLIEDGSTLTNSGAGTLGTYGSETIGRGAAYLALNTDSAGTFTITGDESVWTNSNNIFVGYKGQGTLSIEAGASVSNRAGVIGMFAGSSGEATVTGTGSTWTNSGALGDFYVGRGGTGTLTIADGGSVSNTIGVIGGFVGLTGMGTGNVTVAGEGSNWNNSSILYIGYSNTGTMAVFDGGSVSSTMGRVGYEATSIGTVVVSGPGSTWTIAGGNWLPRLVVGESGNGVMTIEAGGSVTSDVGHLAWSSGSTGTVSVTGAGSTWVNSDSVVVGHQGTGTLTISSGGSVSNSNGYVASQGGASGNVTVSGSSSRWTNSGSLQVGNTAGAGGEGTLTLSGGGTVIVGDTLSIRGNGHVDATFGRLIIPGGPVPVPSAHGIYLGGGGEEGIMEISAGGSITSLAGYVGYRSSGTAIVTGADSIWTNNGYFHVGMIGPGTGELIISDGGRVTSEHGFVGNGTAGTLTITGVGSRWTSSLLRIGHDQPGVVLVEAGGSLSASLGAIGAGASFPGFGPDLGPGWATVSGAGSTWSGNSLYVGFGERSVGSLTVEAGGSVVTNIFSHIGWTWGSHGTVTVGGEGSKWQNNGSLYVGGGTTDRGGTGILTVKDNGAVTVAGNLVVWNDGIVHYEGGTIGAGVVRLRGGGRFLMSSGADKMLVTGGLTIETAGGSVLDLSDNELVVEGGNVSAIGALVSSGWAGGSWDGPGINSSAAAGEAGRALGVGVVGDDVVVRYTWGGDATLDGSVTIADLGILAANWQQTGRMWYEGDFSFDGAVTIADLGILAANWQRGAEVGASLSFEEAMGMFDVFAGVVVPEPGVGGLVMLGVGGLMTRRGRGAGRRRG